MEENKKENRKEKATSWAKKNKKKILQSCGCSALLIALIALSALAVRDSLAARTEPTVSEAKAISEKQDKEKESKERKASTGEDSATQANKEKSNKPEKPDETKGTPTPTKAPVAEPDRNDVENRNKEPAAPSRDASRLQPEAPAQQSVPLQATTIEESVPEAAPQTPTPVPVQSVHQHSFVPVTEIIQHAAKTHTVHHEAVTETVHHDALTHEEPVYEYRTICDSCGADITGAIPSHIGPVCSGSYSAQQVQTGVNVVIDQEAYDETVEVTPAWDEVITDQAAWDETVVTGYRCSCGETRPA